jgi:integrase
MAARKRANGEGSIYRRKDGRWEGAMIASTNAGTRKRIRVYGRSREEVHVKLTEEQAKANHSVPVPAQGWRLDGYLDYWLEEVIHRVRRPATYALYEMVVRLYLKPALGNRHLARLSVPMVQTFLNARLEMGDSIRKVQIMRTVLSSALTRAMREELVVRNVAQLVILPEGSRKVMEAWSVDEARRFLMEAQNHRLYPAFLLLVLYGLRRGEVLGLRRSDIDFGEGVIHIRQQVQRVSGQLLVGPTKTPASRRSLPLVEIVRAPLAQLRDQQTTDRQHSGGPSHYADLVFRTATGRPIEPRNLVRTFDSLCRAAGIRRIRVHDLRRTAATFLNKLGVPARDAQLILGHSRITLTQEIYTDVDRESRTIALNRMQGLFAGDR